MGKLIFTGLLLAGIFAVMVPKMLSSDGSDNGSAMSALEKAKERAAAGAPTSMSNSWRDEHGNWHFGEKPENATPALRLVHEAPEVEFDPNRTDAGRMIDQAQGVADQLTSRYESMPPRGDS